MILLIHSKVVGQIPNTPIRQKLFDSAYFNFQHKNYRHALEFYKQLILIREDVGDMLFCAICYDRLDSIDREKNVLEKSIALPMTNKFEVSLSASCCDMLGDVYFKKRDYRKALILYNLNRVRFKNAKMDDENMTAFDLDNGNSRSRCFEQLKMIDSAVAVLTPYIFCTYKDVFTPGLTDSINMADSLMHNSFCIRYLTLLEKLHTKKNIKAALEKADRSFYYSEKITETNCLYEKDLVCDFTFYGVPIIYTRYGVVDDQKEKLNADTQTPIFSKAYHLKAFRALPLCRMIQALPNEN